MAFLISAAVRWSALAALYLLLAGSLQAAEIAASLLAGLAAASLSLVLCRLGRPRFRLAAPWPLLLGRAGAALLRDVVRVTPALLRAKPGRSVRQPLEAPSSGPAGAGRRALLLLFASLAPNGYVTDERAAPGALPIHRLAAAPPRPDRDWPV